MTEEFYKHMMSEIHELNSSIRELAREVSSLKKYMADTRERIVWVQQKLGLRRMAPVRARLKGGGPPP